MKRGAAILLSVIMLVTLLIPLQASAESENGLENAIKVVKEKLMIPEKLTEFTYNVSTEGNKKVWSLGWNSKEDTEGSLNVSVDGKGTILRYDSYRPNLSPEKKLPKFSRQEVRDKAEKFIQKVNPDIFSQLKLLDRPDSILDTSCYCFNYFRIINGVPFYNDTVYVAVNCETGEIQSYYLNWTDEAVFPAADKVISVEDAQKAFKEKLGLKLVYNYTYVDKAKIFPVYTLKYPDGMYIDALNGERIKINLVGEYRRGDAELMRQKAMGGMDGKGIEALSPEEREAVDKVSKLLTQENAEKIARDLKVIGLTKDFKLQNASLNRDWRFKDEFAWGLSFIKEDSSGGTDTTNIYVNLNAITGEVKSFDTYEYSDWKEKAKYDRAAAKAAVEAFLKGFNSEKFSQTEFDESDDGWDYTNNGKEPPTAYSFNYVRKVNGIQFPSNSIFVSYDAVNGKVTSYNMTWYNVDFPSVDKVMSIEDIYKKLFQEIGLELQYQIQYNPETDGSGRVKHGVFIPTTVSKPQLKLVYGTKREKPVTLDANTGIILNYNGEPYMETKKPEYTDIAGHYAEKQITALAEYGIYLEGTEFKPDENILQKDFLWMLSKTMNNYYIPTETSEDKGLDQMYAFLMREGVVKEGEKAPEQSVTREEGVKFLLRALKYDKAADIKGIYKSTFKDEDQINPDLIGYAAIAHGLKLVDISEGCFKPKDKLTRAQTAVILYNYLNN